MSSPPISLNRAKEKWSIHSTCRLVCVFLKGLKMMLFIDADEYSGVLADSVGALITVHSAHVKPVLDENSIFVAPGSAVFVSLHMVCWPTLELVNTFT